MARRRSRTPRPGSDPSYRELVERVVGGDPVAWREFTERFSNLIFSLLWRYADRDEDLCADLYLYVIENLHARNEQGESFHRLRRYLDSIEQYGGKGRLTTWLGRVTQNLVSDYFRQRDGRRTLPRAVKKMDEASQRIFKLLYWERLSEREAHALFASTSGIDRESFDRRVEEINRSLKTCNRWTIYSEIIRRTPALPIHPQADQDGPAVQLADPDPSTRPDASAACRQQSERARQLGTTLLSCLEEMSAESRLMLIGRFKHDMTAAQIARLLRRDDDKRIYAEIDRLKASLHKALKAAGFDWSQVSGGLEGLEGLLEGVEPAQEPG
ncbi:MAG: sigma-70 family RNA polymerase sigma factor [Deltaproteobacteria bacterium]|nr:sigma-70 family RNA polymerase sigma factor [Deltaproteobacteria bacterium]